MNTLPAVEHIALSLAVDTGQQRLDG